MDGYGIVM